jgi:hypothetical protein
MSSKALKNFAINRLITDYYYYYYYSIFFPALQNARLYLGIFFILAPRIMHQPVPASLHLLPCPPTLMFSKPQQRGLLTVLECLHFLPFSD